MVSPFGSIASTMAADSGNVLLGRGELWAAKINPATGLPDDAGFEPLGNASEFSFNATSEQFERTNYLNEKAVVDLTIILQQAIGISLTLDEVTAENFARFTAGQVDGDYTSQLATAVSNKLISSDARIGARYPLYGASNAPLLGLDLVGSPAPTLTVEVDDNASFTSATALVKDTDFELYTDTGEIRILPGTSVDIDTNKYLRFSYSVGGAVVKKFTQTSLLTGSTVQVALRYVGKNANAGTKFLVELFKVTLSADGDMSLIGQEQSQMTFSGSTESNAQAAAAYGAASNFGRVFSLVNAA